MWTDTELDQALADQPEGPAFSPAARSRARQRLASPVTASRPRRVGWYAAAASVVVLAGAGFAVAGGPTPAASAAAVTQLDRAADAAGRAGFGGTTGPGQYFHTEKHEWALGVAQTRTGQNLAQLQETVYETWVPHDRSLDWVKVTAVTGRARWLVGSDEVVRREGDGGLLTPAGRKREAGPCGDFPGDNGQLGVTGPRLSCADRPGDWYAPTPRFLAGLPTDPDRLYRRLRDDNIGSTADLLAMASGVLAADAPAAVRVAVFGALTRVPGLDVTDNAVNLDGRPGVGLGVVEGATRGEIVIDPGSGRLIGNRMVLARPGTDMWAGLPAGTVAEYTAITTGVVTSVPR